MKGRGKNALGTGMMEWILAQLDEAAGRPVLLTGDGDAFSAGLDLREVASLDGEAMLAFTLLLERCMTALYLYPAPVVAAINGHAIAGGCVLALCCDHRVIAPSPKIKIGLNEVALGIRFPPRILAICRRRVPVFAIEQVILGAALFDPTAALRLGLVDEIAEDPGAIARVRLGALAALPAEAYALTKRDLRGTAAGLCPDDEQERALREAVARWTGPEIKQKIAAIFAR